MKQAFTKASADGMPSIQDNQSQRGAAQPQSPRPEICKLPPPHHPENIPHGPWGDIAPHPRRLQGEQSPRALRGDGKRPPSPLLRAGPGLELLVSILWGGGSSKPAPPPPAPQHRIPGDDLGPHPGWELSNLQHRTHCSENNNKIGSPAGVMQLSDSQDRGRLRSNKNVLEPELRGRCGRIRTGNQRLP